MATASIKPIVYRVSVLPEGHMSYRHYALDVQLRGERWAVVTSFGECLGADGTWDEAVEPYGRGDAWLNAHRFDLKTALRLAEQAAPGITINGRTATEVL